ncbi:MAG: class I SAM-dependent methyltransferase [Bacillota bacterium]
MYKELSQFYDTLMYDCDYEKWSQYFYSHITAGRSGKVVGLELGCGSGEMTIRLKKLGLDIFGLDISPEMLEKAYGKALKNRLQIRFLESSCVDFEFKKNLDFVIAPIDCFSYVCKSDLEKTFANTANHLKSGGVFAFDIRSEHELKTTHANNLFFEDAEDICWFWENQLEKDSVEMNITIFEKIDELYKKHVEKQTFFIHETAWITQALKDAGFEEIQLFTAYGESEFCEESPKLAVCCKKI